MRKIKIERLAYIFRGVSNPKRIIIIKSILAGMNTINAISDYTGIPYKTIERHLQMLHNAGFVKKDRKGLVIDFSLHTDKELSFHNAILDLIRMAR